MCNHDEYNYFPSVTFGGPPGSYVLRPPVPSNDHVEFCVVAVTCDAGGPSDILVSGVDKPGIIDTSGVSTYSDQTFIKGQYFRANTNTTTTPNESWERIANSQGNIFASIVGGTAVFITIKTRVKILNRIPAPSTTVHPDLAQQTHYERERRIEQAVLGREGELDEYGRRPAKAGTIRSLQTGRAIDPTNGR